MKKLIKTILKIVLVLLLAIIVAVGGLLGWLTLTEYKPEPLETLEPVQSDPNALVLTPGEELDIMSWNIGYAGLGAELDFFMDGGTSTGPKERAEVVRYLDGIYQSIRDEGCSLVLLQEVDTNSSRTFSINEAKSLAWGTSYHALNYACPFVPVPMPPMGKVNSGLLTLSDYAVESAQRQSLPCPFTWPLRIANLKRCLLVSYLPIEGSEQKLVLVNLHLEAYDSGEGKIAQTRQLRDFIQSEYEKGNYVIAGGDFNQVFPDSLDVYPNTHPDNWIPGVLDSTLLPEGEGWRYAYDLDTPSCRLLNQPYDPSDTVNTQYYVIDGFIISPNVELLQVETLDLGFANSDHNPVSLKIRLG